MKETKFVKIFQNPNYDIKKIVIEIAASLEVSPVFPPTALIGFSNVKEKEKGLKPPFGTVFVRFSFLSPPILFCKSQR